MKIALICCYFGCLPRYFPFFCKTFERNKEIDLFLVTDCVADDMPENIHIIPMTFNDLCAKIQTYFNFEIVLDRPYKLCDYKPTYGMIFQELLVPYEYWGHCDLDVFWGDVASFLPGYETNTDTYDKIYELGHLTLYKNTDENNRRFMLPGSCEYTEVFSSKDIFGFDEIAGMQNKFDYHHIPTYISRDYADITYGRVRFTLSDFRLKPEQIKTNNYEKQIFYWEDGHLFRAYWEGGKLKVDEFNYIHFSKRVMPIPDDISENAFYITRYGVIPKTGEVTLADIERLNSSTRAEESKRARECKIAGYKRAAKYYWGILQKKANFI